MKLKYRKKSTKQGRILEGGGEEFFWLTRIYTPAGQLISKTTLKISVISLKLFFCSSLYCASCLKSSRDLFSLTLLLKKEDNTELHVFCFVSEVETRSVWFGCAIRGEKKSGPVLLATSKLPSVDIY